MSDIPPGPALILVKHSLPEIDPTVPARRWLLGEEGRRRCVPLADALRPCEPVIVVSSDEPKASTTGAIVADLLGCPHEVAPGLHEHRRETVPWLDDATFQAGVAGFFARPDELVFGEETAHAAQERFAAAIGRVERMHPEGTVAVVAHGTVISLYVAARTGTPAHPLWRRLGLPSFVALDRATHELTAIVGRIDRR